MERRKEGKRKDGEIQGQDKEEGPRRTPGAHVGSGEQPLMSSMVHSPWGCQEVVMCLHTGAGEVCAGPTPREGGDTQRKRSKGMKREVGSGLLSPCTHFVLTQR